MIKKYTIILISLLILSVKSMSQDSSRFYFTTSVGLLSPVSSFGNAYKTSLALNSGIEYKINHVLFAQIVLDFNAVKYDQQLKDDNSDYLFQKTNSSIFLAGLNFGRNIYFGKRSIFFSSIYTGTGYVNIGEPRLTVNNSSHIIEQHVERMPGVFGKGGIRLAVKTTSKLLQTIYVDGSYWLTNLTIQQSRVQAISLYIGTRFGF